MRWNDDMMSRHLVLLWDCSDDGKRCTAPCGDDTLSKEKPMRRLTIMIPEELVAGLEEVAEINGGGIGCRAGGSSVGGDIATLDQLVSGRAQEEEAWATWTVRHHFIGCSEIVATALDGRLSVNRLLGLPSLLTLSDHDQLQHPAMLCP